MRPAQSAPRRSRWVLVRFWQRWATWYKRLFWRSAWPLRIALVVIGVGLIILAATIFYQLAAMVIGFVVLFLVLALVSGRLGDMTGLWSEDYWSHLGSSRELGPDLVEAPEYLDEDDDKHEGIWETWRREEQEYTQEMFDVDQRQQEDEGR